MANKFTKKGPHSVSTACKPETPEMTDREVGALIKAHAEKAHRIIQKARRKMTPEERERADANANAILENASAAAKSSRRRA